MSNPNINLQSQNFSIQEMSINKGYQEPILSDSIQSDDIRLPGQSPDKLQYQLNGFRIQQPQSKIINSSSRQAIQENRKQNQLLISINCSKAIDNQNYKDQANMLRYQQSLNAAGSMRSQSTVESNRMQMIKSQYQDNSNNINNQYQQRTNLQIKPLNFMIQKPQFNVNLTQPNKKGYQINNDNYRAQSSLRSTAQNVLNLNTNKKQSILNDSTLGTSRSVAYNGRTKARYQTQQSGQSARKQKVNQSFQTNASLILPNLNNNGFTIQKQKQIRYASINNSVERDNLNLNQQPLEVSVTKNSSQIEQDLLLHQSQITSQNIFNKDRQQTKSVMYNRAMNKLKSLLNNKGLQETVLEQSNYGLYHFHIETSDNNIQLNKFESSPQQYRTFSSQHMENHNTSIHMNPDTLMNVQDQSIHLNVTKLEKTSQNKRYKRQETEEMISDNLLKNSPAFKHRRISKRNEQFMMNLKPTNALGEESSVSDFSARKQALEKQQQVQRTILFIKEVDDNEKDFLNMEIKEFVHLDSQEMQQAYNRLMKSVVPIFSGGIDTLINKIDMRKVQENNNPFAHLYRINPQIKDTSSLNEVEQSLIDQLKTCKNKLENQEIVYGQWSILQQQGSIPDSREGATACMIDNNLYLFGGFSRDLFRDVRVFDMQTQKWRLIQPSKGNLPNARFAHTLCQHGNKLYIFGGAGPYINSIKMRLSYNDVQIFDIDQEQWLNEADIEGAPKKRQNHIGGMLGSIMIVHGGFNTEQKKSLNDFGLYDADTNKWINAKVFYNGERIDDKHYMYDDSQDYHLGFRQMHSATVVVNQEYHQDNQNQTKFKDKHIWLFKHEFSKDDIKEEKSFDEGIYVFGGCNQHGHIMNDIWIIEPHFNENQKYLNHQTYEYMTKPTLSINLRKIDDFKGKSPCPRISHATTLFKDWNNHYIIVIYGGRNDGIFAKTQNVAMNDICLFNVNLKEWQALAIYGQIPCSRWSHVLTMNGNSRGDGFIVFGGVNLKNYCKSRLYQFEIWNSWYKQKRINGEKLIDEKHDMLSNNVKEKIDIIKDIMNKRRS